MKITKLPPHIVKILLEMHAHVQALEAAGVQLDEFDLSECDRTEGDAKPDLSQAVEDPKPANPDEK